VIGPTCRPRLKPHARLRADARTGSTFLLYPERGLKLNATALRTLELCAEGQTFADIVAVLAAESGAPPLTVAGDAGEFLSELSRRGVLDGAVDAAMDWSDP
jgi:hypothetical protein